MRLEQDPKPPFVHLARSDVQMTEFFNRHVLPMVWPGHEVAAVDLQRLFWTPGQERAALYELRFGAPTEAPVQAVVTFAEGKRALAKVYARHYSGDATSSDKRPRPALFLPDHRCLVEFFPNDWRLPSLARLTSPGEMLPILVAALGNEAEPHQWRCDVSVLKYRPHNRCVLLYKVRAPDSDDRREVVGKVYKNATKAAKTYAKQRRLHAAAADRGLTIPRPLALVDELNLVLMDRVRGASMQNLLHMNADPEPMARTAAAALATLHSLPFEGSDVRGFPHLLMRYRKQVDCLRLVAPDLAAEIDNLVSRIERWEGECAPVAPCLIHGDYTLDQLLLGDGGVAIVDLDSIGPGDPAIDVGSFMAKCRTNAQLMGEKRAELPEYFLAEYLARAGAGSGFAERAQVYCSLKFVRKAVRAFLSKPHRYARSPISSLPAILLKEAARHLSGRVT